ncbi:MAG TPA: UDP-N-acetylmuramoyl-L-alanyl-D-glutamate--2,6-diaminopimelate ligase [Polyangia bacterium]|nr:UDP-N-acetylmuramoyl-L-alanyl-D-glutamate--2,6-diaminopimelate ligase [Polyangia bacterium]
MSGLTLGELLRGVEGARSARPRDAAFAGVSVGAVRDDSRQVGPGDLFVAVPGEAADGRKFVSDAAARGAAALVTEGDAPADFPGVAVLVPSARRALGVIAANRTGAAGALTLMAVTGTNGKTTTTYLLEAMLQAAGRTAGVFGTIAYRAPGLPGRAAPLTTPGALMLHDLLAQMRAAGTTDVVLEATSHALEQGRLDGCRFRVAGLTNLTQDHLDYHGTMAQYEAAKAILFERLLDPARGVAVTFADDEAGRRMHARARGAGTLTVARRSDGAPGADVVVQRATLSAGGTRATFATPTGSLEIESPLVGGYNLDNLALAVGMAIAGGLDGRAIAEGAAGLSGVPGRLERVPNRRGVLCLVDYAHTPDALERAIAAARPLAAASGATRGRVIVVFGCGGDRDRGKRPLMGEIAARDADLAVVTSDNPRSEDPAAIVAQIVEGVRRAGGRQLTSEQLAGGGLGPDGRGYHVEVDRRTAIQRAAAAAAAGDVLLIAGKGHEDYQIVGSTRLHFDDREEAAAALALPG